MSVLLLSLMLGANEPSLEGALQAALTREAAKVHLTAWEAPTCKGEYTPAPFDSSGRVPVRVRGKQCEAWGWAHVRVTVPVATLSRDVKPNQSLEGAWSVQEHEPRGETLPAVPAGASATRTLRKGTPVGPNDVRVGPALGTSVTVKVLMGALSLEQRGTVSACTGGGTCATLPSGKKVSGVWADGTLVVGGGS